MSESTTVIQTVPRVLRGRESEQRCQLGAPADELAGNGKGCRSVPFIVDDKNGNTEFVRPGQKIQGMQVQGASKPVIQRIPDDPRICSPSRATQPGSMLDRALATRVLLQSITGALSTRR